MKYQGLMVTILGATGLVDYKNLFHAGTEEPLLDEKWEDGFWTE